MGPVFAFALTFCGCFPCFLDVFLLSLCVSYFFGSSCFCLSFSCMLASLSHWLLCSVFVGLLVGFVSSFIGVLSLCCVCARVVTLLCWDFCLWLAGFVLFPFAFALYGCYCCVLHVVVVVCV